MNCPVPGCDGRCYKTPEDRWRCQACGAEERENPATSNMMWVRNGTVVLAPADVKESHERMVENYGDKLSEEDKQFKQP